MSPQELSPNSLITIRINMSRLATTIAPIAQVHAARWSPRSFDAAAELTRESVLGSLEAARWAPSANNVQPWRFVVGFRGDDTFATIAANLMSFNAVWAPQASALVVNIAHTTDAEGKENAYALYDLGQAVAHFTLQAAHDGLFTHQMGGINREELDAAFNVPAGFSVISVTAVGSLGAPEALPPVLAEREVAPRTRSELDDIVSYGPLADSVAAAA
jgi:nitroreductase